MFRETKRFKLLYYLLIAFFIVLFIFVLVKLFPLYGATISFLGRLFFPFIIACFIAYLLYPIINILQQYNIHRTLAIMLIYILFFGGTAYLIYRVYPAIIHQLEDLNEHLPQFISQYENIISKVYESTSFLPETVHDQIDQLIQRIEKLLENIVEKLMGGFTKIFDFIILITVIPVLVFYFLKDYDKIKQYLKRFIPTGYQQQVAVLIHAIDEKLGSYIRGQLLVSSLVSLITLIAFHLLGVKYALLLAVIMGLTNIIPYFGPIIGAIPAIAITLTVSTKLVIFVIITIFVIQLIESNFISPYVVGKSINIHPIAIIFALLLGGQLKGVIGMILAVPVLTILKVLLTHLPIFRRSH